MQESLNDINTSLEAHRLVKDPAKLLSLLFSKYGDVREDYYTSFINQIIYKCSSHFNVQYKEIQYNDIIVEFLRRFYRKREVKERIPNLYDYYKNYHLFYLKPILRNFYLENLMHNYQDKKAEIFYKNNYSRTTNEKNITDDNSGTSSLSSSDHYTNNKIIFNTKTKLLIDGKSGSKNEHNKSLMNFEVSKIKKDENNINENLRLSIKTNDENTLTEIMKEIINDNKDNNNNMNSRSKKNNKTKTQRNSKKNHSPKIHSKSPTFQIHHQIQLIKSTSNNTNNNNYNLISPQMYILSQKNSYLTKKNNSHKNKIYFSPKRNYYFNNISSKFEEMLKKYPNYFFKIRQKRSKTGNNSNNNTIKKSINNNNNNISNNIFGKNNFQSNFKNFSKLSAALKNNKFNITYFSQLNSNNISRGSMSGTKTSKLHKNKKVINEVNQNQSNIKSKKVRHKKNKTFDFNAAKGKFIELKKNNTNYNLLRFRPSPSNVQNSKKPIGLNFNLMKSPKNEVILRNSHGSNGHSNKNKRYINRKNKIKKNIKSFISIASCSSPKFSFSICKNETNVKESLNNNNINNIENNMHNFLTNNKKIITKLKKNKYRKNNISYTNNNFNINFNNVFFCSSRPMSGQHSNNIISDNINTNGNIQMNKNVSINNNNCNINNINNLTNNNSISLINKKHNPIIGHRNNILNSKNIINNNYSSNISNLYVKSLNNIYNFSRNKSNKITNCSKTQTQSQSIAKNSKIIKICESKIAVNKTNSFILHCNNKSIIDEKSINKIQKKYKRTKMINQIEDLIMKSKKNIKFGSEQKNKIGGTISNKPVFNNCNNKSKNQTQNKSNYHEMFIKNLKRTSSTSIKVNTKFTSNNNQAINVIYKK